MPEFDFGHFHVIEELGRGGMALVYKAVDTQTEETVALKILYPHLMSDEKNIARFKREGNVATQLRHKYIVPVIDFGEYDNQIYIAMKYMPGNSLAELFEEPRNIKMKGIIRILGEVASALDYAHDKGVIHRDLKLQNILLDEKRHAHLSDFGIARLVDGTRLTATGQIAGTPMYMSPEQIRGKPVDSRSDIYSFSVMAYLLLTGYYPFTGEDSLAIIHKHVKEFPPTPTDVNDELPPAVDTVLLRGLMKLPKDRYQTTMEMVKALYKAVNTPELHQTSTRIDIRAINPVDSVEIDAPKAPTENIIQTPTRTSNSPELQSDLSSAVITAQQTLTGSSNRSGVFGIAFGAILVLAVTIPILLVVLGGTNNSDNTQVIMDNAQTQARLQAELEVEQTSSAALETQLAEEELDEDEDEDEVDSDELPPTWTFTPEPTQPMDFVVTSDPENVTIFNDFDGANGYISAIGDVQVIDKPGPNSDVIMTLPNGTAVEIIGKNAGEDFWEIVVSDGTSGFVFMDMVDTDVQVNTVAVTDAGPPDRPDGRGRGNRGGDGD